MFRDQLPDPRPKRQWSDPQSHRWQSLDDVGSAAAKLVMVDLSAVTVVGTVTAPATFVGIPIGRLSVLTEASMEQQSELSDSALQQYVLELRTGMFQ
jgi:hypothetical protein